MLLFIETPDLILEMGGESYKIAKSNFDVHKVNQDMADIVLGAE